MNKWTLLTRLSCAIAPALLITACANLQESASIAQPQVIQEKPLPASLRSVVSPPKKILQASAIQPPVAPPRAEPVIINPVIIDINSLVDLTAIFTQLDYNRHLCTQNNCAIPRITFNKINKDWPKESKKLPVTVKKELFFHLMMPLILMANENIKNERAIIKNSAINAPALTAIALKYRMIKQSQDKLSENLRSKLLQRVDILPPSLALAQAAEESGWATSRFVIQGNAFFGQWDYSGKGMKPLRQRSQLGNYGIARFASPLACVEGYMLNINSNMAYQKLRTLRAQLRADNKEITGYTLAGKMGKYSERGQAYIKGLRSIIRYNNLGPLDLAYLGDNDEVYININEIH